MFQEQAIFIPALVRLHRHVDGARKDLRAHEVERRHAGFTAACNVQRRKVKRQAKQVVAQGARNELVDFRTDLVRRALDNRIRRIRTEASIAQRIREGFDQPHRGHLGLAEIRIRLDRERWQDRIVEAQLLLQKRIGQVDIASRALENDLLDLALLAAEEVGDRQRVAAQHRAAAPEVDGEVAERPLQRNVGQRFTARQNDRIEASKLRDQVVAVGGAVVEIIVIVAATGDVVVAGATNELVVAVVADHGIPEPGSHERFPDRS